MAVNSLTCRFSSPELSGTPNLAANKLAYLLAWLAPIEWMVPVIVVRALISGIAAYSS